MQAKRNAEAAKRRERELLFAGVQEGSTVSGQGRRKGQDPPSKDQLELNASSDVTAALRRVHSLMQSEVSRSQFALETLRELTDPIEVLPLTNSAHRPIDSRAFDPFRIIYQIRDPPVIFPLLGLNPLAFPEIRHLVSGECFLDPCLYNRLACLSANLVRPWLVAVIFTNDPRVASCNIHHTSFPWRLRIFVRCYERWKPKCGTKSSFGTSIIDPVRAAKRFWRNTDIQQRHVSTLHSRWCRWQRPAAAKQAARRAQNRIGGGGRNG